jgi:enamine deaminase RidA (YjgF/YER057c/UK114 family)
MKREIIRVEPLATYLEKYKAPVSTVTKHGDTIYVSGAPPFDPKTGHYAAWEQPQMFSEEVRAGFRSLRKVAKAA